MDTERIEVFAKRIAAGEGQILLIFQWKMPLPRVPEHLRKTPF
jgi:hypothetical protein